MQIHVYNVDGLFKCLDMPGLSWIIQGNPSFLRYNPGMICSRTYAPPCSYSFGNGVIRTATKHDIEFQCDFRIFPVFLKIRMPETFFEMFWYI